MDYFFNFEKLAYLEGKKPSGCILCLIRDQDAAVIDLSIFRGDGFIVCLNLYPYNPGHLMVFPERHIQDVRELHEKERSMLNLLIDRSLDALDRVYKPAGYNIGCNMGLVAGASIDHLHWHVIPRYAREIGMAELISGKRVLVDHPLDSKAKIAEAFALYQG